ncbi:MAG: hypothetical protein IPJ19_03365 [Planctomycetes bacterium]|nr:hypothetical protein [Planctomycetota bacterium]
MRSAIALTALLALTSGCALLVPAGAGYVVATTTDDSTYIVQVKTGVEVTWASTKTTLSHLSLKPVDTDDERRSAIAEIDSSKVTVTVEAYDLDQSVIKVSATKFALRDTATANMVKDKILSDLERKN